MTPEAVARREHLLAVTMLGRLVRPSTNLDERRRARLLHRTLMGPSGPLEGMQAETLEAFEALQEEMVDETLRLQSMSQDLSTPNLDGGGSGISSVFEK